MDKDSIRKLALARRSALTKEEVQMYSQQICAKVELYLHGNIALYHAYGKEVDLAYLKLSSKAKSIALPKTFPDYTIKFYEIDEDSQYEESAFGIVEPCVSKEVLAANIDVMLIPLVAFDDACHRMGHGKGFYDRYLANFSGLRIGIAYECQKFDSIPILDHDEGLDMIISEASIYRK